MEPRFEKTTGYAIIEWLEPKENSSPEKRYFEAGINKKYSKQLLRCQLHPKNPKKVVRLHFSGKMPDWLVRYAKVHHFKCQSEQFKNEQGFWLARWNDWGEGEKPFTAPTIEGAIKQFIHSIPDFVEEPKQKLLDHFEDIKHNLIHHPHAFEAYGVYYRKADVGEGGCLIIDDVIPERESEWDDEQYKQAILSHGKLERLVWEIITPIPEVIEPEDVEESDIEEVSFFEDNEEDKEQFIIIEDDKEDEIIIIETDDEEELILDEFDEEEIILEDDEELTELELLDEEENLEELEKDETASKTVVEEEQESHQEQEAEIEEATTDSSEHPQISTEDEVEKEGDFEKEELTTRPSTDSKDEDIDVHIVQRKNSKQNFDQLALF